MRKFDSAILVVLMVLSATSSYGAILSTSDAQQKVYFESCLENPNGPCQSPSHDVDMTKKLITEIEADIDREVQAAGISRDAYLSTDAPFNIILTALQSEELKKMDRVDMTISLIKLGFRYRTIQNTRFVAPHFFENEQTFLRLVRELSAQHKLPFQI